MVTSLHQEFCPGDLVNIVYKQLFWSGYQYKSEPGNDINDFNYVEMYGYNTSIIELEDICIVFYVSELGPRRIGDQKIIGILTPKNVLYAWSNQLKHI